MKNSNILRISTPLIFPEILDLYLQIPIYKIFSFSAFWDFKLYETFLKKMIEKRNIRVRNCQQLPDFFFLYQNKETLLAPHRENKDEIIGIRITSREFIINIVVPFILPVVMKSSNSLTQDNILKEKKG